LKALALRYTSLGNYDDNLDKTKNALNVDNYMQIPHASLLKYAVLDAIATWRIHHALEKQMRRLDKKYPNEKLAEWTLERHYHEVMIPYYQDIIRAEYDGMYVNAAQRDVGQRSLEAKLASLKDACKAIWNPVLIEKGHAPIADDFNFASPTQLGTLLEKMGWPKVTVSESGGYTTDDVSQDEWRRLGLKGIDELAELRSYLVALGSFTGYIDERGNKKGWLQFMEHHDDDDTWRMHANFNCMGCETFRNSVKSPSLQNIPTHGSTAAAVKQALSTPKPVPNYTVTSPDSVVWSGRGDDRLITQRGSVPFCALTASDTILDYAHERYYTTEDDYTAPEDAPQLLKIEHDDDYYEIAVVDFISQECVLASIDECLNPTGIDQIMYDIYGVDGVMDMHSVTSYGFFGKPVALHILDIEDENGKHWVFHEENWAKIERNGEEMSIPATEIVATDRILGRAKNTKKRVTKFD
jgi:hypothetical protein